MNISLPVTTSSPLKPTSYPANTPRFTRLQHYLPRLTLATFFVVVCLSSSVLALAQAQTVSPDQQLQRQQERDRQLRQQQEAQPDVRLPRSEAAVTTGVIPENESPCFPIERIVLRGEMADQFAYALKSVTQGREQVLGRCLGVTGINTVMARVQNVLVEQGYVTTRVLAAPQDLTRGELVLTLVPGKVRRIAFAPDASARGTQWNAVPIARGDMLNVRDIEQGLENFKRVPTAEADIQIVPATGDDAQPGESDLVIAYQQATPFRIALSLDDSGSKSTGKYQGGVTLSYDNGFTLNDLFYVSFNHDLGGGQAGVRGNQSVTVHYSLPLGYWHLGFTTSSSQYHQSVAGAYQSYLYSGTSESGEIKLARLLYRDAVRKTTASLKTFLKRSHNFVDGTEVEVQRRATGGWELGLAHREFMGDSTLDIALAYRRGTGAFSAMEAPEELFGEGTSRFKIVTADLSLVVPMKLTMPWGQQHLRYNLTARGQWNGTRLTAQDRFSIGGRYTVRGFDGESSLMAERGWLVRNELGIALGSTGQESYLGLDYGEVAGPSAAMLVGTRLAGTVLGLRGNVQGVAYDVFVGTPVAKPARFQSASVTAGFNLNWSY